MVILTVDPLYRRSAYLLNEDSGIWRDDGAWYSNLSFLSAALDYDHLAADEDLFCGPCSTLTAIDPFSGCCAVCGSCPDCDELGGYCSCYRRTSLGRATS
ncbi:hypothetical protein KUTG_09991 [Kutzneria sp. 744]|nr:hypothetical protein KUTG_09991 [Kutzneria sp. 744]